MASPQPAARSSYRRIEWVDGEIEGCEIVLVKRFADQRGWLSEVFRFDDLSPEHRPVMSYVSLTRPGVARGPHEHAAQTDLFALFNGTVKLFLWDVRPNSQTYGTRMVGVYGDANPATVRVPPGVVHGYLNIGDTDVLIVNSPNKLYGGWDRTEPVDEIRHEDVPGSPFAMDPDA